MTGKTYAVCEQEINFNSHAHVERDNLTEVNVMNNKDFNSHAHVERDCFATLFVKQNMISTHTLTWSVTLSSMQGLLRVRFQLTRSRGA